MSRRYPDVVRETNGRPTVRGYCAWYDDGELCDVFGPTVKGLCRRHYDQLRHRAEVQAHHAARRIDGLPTTCTCRYPRPVQVRIIGGAVLVDGAYQCGTCGRAVLE